MQTLDNPVTLHQDHRAALSEQMHRMPGPSAGRLLQLMLEYCDNSDDQLLGMDYSRYTLVGSARRSGRLSRNYAPQCQAFSVWRCDWFGQTSLMKAIAQSRVLRIKKIVRNALFYIITATLVIIYFVFEPMFMSLEQAQEMIAAYDSKTMIYLIVFAIMLVCALTPLPAELIALVNALMFSPMEAFLVTWLSAVFSAYVGYEIGRLNWFNPCEAGDDRKICRWLRTHGYVALAVMRLIPIVPFFALNICGGVFKLNRAKYTVITAVCIIPAVVLLTAFPHLFT